MKKQLYDAAMQLEIELSERQLEQFVTYYEQMIEKNKVMNLTAITDPEEVIMKHFIDSIAVVKYCDLHEKKIIDVGTGAGFPGIPLAILIQDSEFILMDSLNKRLNFLNEVIQKNGLKNVTTCHSRAEDLGHNQEYREKFDICVSRAVANLSVLLEYCIPFLNVGGKFISYKSALVEEELANSKHAQKELGCELKKNIEWSMDEADIHRRFLIFEKKEKLKAKYPRQAGKPKRNPL